MALWDYIKKGTLDFVTSGHMPTDPVLKLSKDGDFYSALPGVSSIELLLPAFWTYYEKVGQRYWMGCEEEGVSGNDDKSSKDDNDEVVDMNLL